MLGTALERANPWIPATRPDNTEFPLFLTSPVAVDRSRATFAHERHERIQRVLVRQGGRRALRRRHADTVMPIGRQPDTCRRHPGKAGGTLEFGRRWSTDFSMRAHRERVKRLGRLIETDNLGQRMLPGQCLA
jgi:hypothetical protein